RTKLGKSGVTKEARWQLIGTNRGQRRRSCGNLEVSVQRRAPLRLRKDDAMPMRPRFWTINGLATETGDDRRLVAKRLADTKPDGMVRSEPAWLLRTYLAAAAKLTGYEAERARYMKLRADALAQEAAVRSGELVPIGPVSEARGLQFKLMANHLMRLPAM